MLVKIVTIKNGNQNNHYCQRDKLDGFKLTLTEAGHEIKEIILADHSQSFAFRRLLVMFRQRKSKKINWNDYFFTIERNTKLA